MDVYHTTQGIRVGGGYGRYSYGQTYSVEQAREFAGKILRLAEGREEWQAEMKAERDAGLASVRAAREQEKADWLALPGLEVLPGGYTFAIGLHNYRDLAGRLRVEDRVGKTAVVMLNGEETKVRLNARQRADITNACRAYEAEANEVVEQAIEQARKKAHEAGMRPAKVIYLVGRRALDVYDATEAQATVTVGPRGGRRLRVEIPRPIDSYIEELEEYMQAATEAVGMTHPWEGS